ncbi:MAG: hypothetical protein SFY66_25710 [Oculatellaceae cyanobacterium bins.114]|nr:hypothetical protein [Oculatellaceae cyanobacterium bins.114]
MKARRTISFLLADITARENLVPPTNTPPQISTGYRRMVLLGSFIVDGMFAN